MSRGIPIDDVLRVVRDAPEGLTTAQVAERLGARPKTIAARLCKSADYGWIDRDIRRGPNCTPRKFCIWKPKDRHA